MTIHAYSSEYLPDLRERLGILFDLAVYQIGLDIDEAAETFASSAVAEGIENREPRYLAGRSGMEMAREVFERDGLRQPTLDRTDAYWVGYALAHLQWYFDRPFGEVISRFPCGRLLDAYPALHEADIDKTVDLARKFITPDNVIRRRRKVLGLTQAELAALVGISLPTMRAYEQGVTDLENASGRTLYLLGRHLGLTVEEILHG